MREVDTKLKAMYELLALSDLHSFSHFLNAEKNGLRNIPWALKDEIVKVNGVRKRPRVRFLGKQDVLYKQLYRYFIGDLPEKQLVPLNSRNDYNPWHWQAKGVSNIAIPLEEVIVETLDPALKDLADLIETRKLHGHKAPWFEVDEIYSEDEIAKVREFLDAD